MPLLPAGRLCRAYHFCRVRESAGNINECGGKSYGTFLHRLFYQAVHFTLLIGCWKSVLAFHHLFANRVVSHQRCHVDGRVQTIYPVEESFQVAGRAPQLPVTTVVTPS